MNKTEAAWLMTADFIPRGAKIDPTGLAFRRTLEHEVYHCTARTGADPQSGPYYCGRLAEWIHVTETGVLPACQLHRPHGAVFA